MVRIRCDEADCDAGQSGEDVTAARFRVGVDIGGTFTDILLLDADGRIHTKKVSSSVADYAQAIVEGLCELFDETGLGGGAVDEVIHGTTVASNAILELRGARTGLITTTGFRDGGSFGCRGSTT